MPTKNNFETIDLFIYQRMVNKKDKSGKFPKDKCSYQDVSFDVHYSKACSDKLTADMLKNGIKFPIRMTLSDDQYFLKPQQFTRNDGTTDVKQIVIIKDYMSIVQDEFRKGTTLQEMAAAIKAGREAMEEVEEVEDLDE